MCGEFYNQQEIEEIKNIIKNENGNTYDIIESLKFIYPVMINCKFDNLDLIIFNSSILCKNSERTHCNVIGELFQNEYLYFQDSEKIKLKLKEPNYIYYNQNDKKALFNILTKKFELKKNESQEIKDIFDNYNSNLGNYECVGFVISTNYLNNINDTLAFHYVTYVKTGKSSENKWTRWDALDINEEEEPFSVEIKEINDIDAIYKKEMDKGSNENKDEDPIDSYRQFIPLFLRIDGEENIDTADLIETLNSIDTNKEEEVDNELKAKKEANVLNVKSINEKTKEKTPLLKSSSSSSSSLPKLQKTIQVNPKTQTISPMHEQNFDEQNSNKNKEITITKDEYMHDDNNDNDDDGNVEITFNQKLEILINQSIEFEINNELKKAKGNNTIFTIFNPNTPKTIDILTTIKENLDEEKNEMVSNNTIKNLNIKYNKISKDDNYEENKMDIIKCNNKIIEYLNKKLESVEEIIKNIKSNNDAKENLKEKISNLNTDKTPIYSVLLKLFKLKSLKQNEYLELINENQIQYDPRHSLSNMYKWKQYFDYNDNKSELCAIFIKSLSNEIEILYSMIGANDIKLIEQDDSNIAKNSEVNIDKMYEEHNSSMKNLKINLSKNKNGGKRKTKKNRKRKTNKKLNKLSNNSSNKKRIKKKKKSLKH